MRNIVLFCSAGMSTSVMVRKMEEAAKAMNYLRAQKDVTVEEVPDYHA